MITFLEFLAEVKFHYNHGHNEITSRHRSGEYETVVSYSGRGKKPHDGLYQRKYYDVAFSVDDEYHGSNEHISAFHKHKMMRDAGHSVHEFIKQYKPSGLHFKPNETDPDQDRKLGQYKRAANLVAKAHGGKVTHDDEGSHVNF